MSWCGFGVMADGSIDCSRHKETGELARGHLKWGASALFGRGQALEAHRRRPQHQAQEAILRRFIDAPKQIGRAHV